MSTDELVKEALAIVEDGDKYGALATHKTTIHIRQTLERLAAEITRLSEALGHAEGEKRKSFERLLAVEGRLAASEAERERLIVKNNNLNNTIVARTKELETARAALAAAPPKPAQPARDDVLEEAATAVDQMKWYSGRYDADAVAARCAAHIRALKRQGQQRGEG